MLRGKLLVHFNEKRAYKAGSLAKRNSLNVKDITRRGVPVMNNQPGGNSFAG